MIYTEKEQTTLTHTVQDAISFAKHLLKERRNITHVELNHLSENKLAPSTPITMEQLNNISDQLVKDSVAYSNGARFVTAAA